MTQYHELCYSSLDTADLGFLPCTPASGTLGTDTTGAVQLCTLPGHGNMIFAASKGQYTPIAANFSDFLGLLLACGHLSLMCKIPQWTRLRFNRELHRQQLTHKQRMICNALKNCFYPPIIDDPYAYVRKLQKNSANTISQPGSSMSVQLGTRQWEARQLRILDDGIELDVCVRIPGEQIVAFCDRWENASPDEEQSQEKSVTDPFALQTNIFAVMGGNKLPTTILEELHWDPLSDNSAPIRERLDSLQLDPENGWIMLQLRLHTGKRKKKAVRSLSLQLVSDTVTIPGLSFSTPMADTSLSTVHPADGKQIKLTIHSCNAEELDPNFLTYPPCHYTRLCYSTEPAMNCEAFSVFDPMPNDPLRTPPGCTTAYPDPELENAPTASLAETDETLPTHIHTAFSARHYRPQNSVLWHTAFRCKRYPDGILPIIR